MKSIHKEIYFNRIIKPAVEEYCMNKRKVILNPSYLTISEQMHMFRTEIDKEEVDSVMGNDYFGGSGDVGGNNYGSGLLVST